MCQVGHWTWFPHWHCFWCLVPVCRNVTECRLFQKASGFAGAVSSRRHVPLTAVFVQTAVERSNRPATAAGLMLHVRCGSPKLASRITCSLSRSMDWRGSRRPVDAWRAASADAAVPEPAFSAIAPTATLRSTLRVHSWPVSTWRWHLYDWVTKAPVAAAPSERCARLPTATFIRPGCLTMEIWLPQKWKHYSRTRCDGRGKFLPSDVVLHLSFLFLWYLSTGNKRQVV